MLREILPFDQLRISASAALQLLRNIGWILLIHQSFTQSFTPGGSPTPLGWSLPQTANGGWPAA